MASSYRPTSGTADLAGLASRFRGDVIGLRHPGYDTHRRVWNGSIDRRPALIARCVDVADVVAAVRHARETELELAVRSGGHSFPGHSVVDGGLVLDLRRMRRVQVDPVAGVARVQAGALLGEMDRATQAFGLAAPTGAVSHTGVAGLTLGGGIGWLMRKHGLALDQLRAADVVTADGQLLRASEHEEPELFWALRGGGGNFGVVTEFEFALHPVGPTVISGMVLWAFEDAAAVCSHYREWSREAPNEATTALVLRKAAAVDLIPRNLHGRPVVGVLGCWAGPLQEGEAFWEPLRRFGRPVVDLVGRRPFVEHQQLLDASYPHGRWVYMKACDVREANDEVLAIAVEHAARLGSPNSGTVVWQLGGAVADVPDDATAFGSRDAGAIINVSGISEGAEGFGREREWVRDHWDALRPHQTSVYVNFLMDADTDRIRTAYGAARFDRLRAVKASYDPENVFHLNQNIPPA